MGKCWVAKGPEGGARREGKDERDGADGGPGSACTAGPRTDRESQYGKTRNGARYG